MAEIVDLSKRDFPATIYKIPLGDRWNSNDYHFAQCFLDEIEVPEDRQWELSEDNIQQLMKSIKSDKMICPIGVQFLKTRNGSHRFRLIYGLHRFEATKRLRAEYLAENPDVDPNRDSTYFTANAAVFSCDLTEEQMHRIEAIENLHRRQLTDEERLKIGAVLAAKKLSKLIKSKSVVSEGVRQSRIANAKSISGKTETVPIDAKSISGKTETVIKSKYNAGKAVTLNTMAESYGGGKTSIQDSLEVAQAVTGVRFDLNDNKVMEELDRKLDEVMILAAENEEIAERVRTTLGVLSKPRSPKIEPEQVTPALLVQTMEIPQAEVQRTNPPESDESEETYKFRYKACSSSVGQLSENLNVYRQREDRFMEMAKARCPHVFVGLESLLLEPVEILERILSDKPQPVSGAQEEAPAFQKRKRINQTKEVWLNRFKTSLAKCLSAEKSPLTWVKVSSNMRNDDELSASDIAWLKESYERLLEDN